MWSQIKVPSQVATSRKAAKEVAAAEALAAQQASQAAAKAKEQSLDNPLTSLVNMASHSGSGRRGGRGGGRGGRGRGQGSSKPTNAPEVPKVPEAPQDVEFGIKDLFGVTGGSQPKGASKKVIDLQLLLQKEFDAYDKEAPADLFDDPAQWWLSRTKSGILGVHVAMLARQCLAIPGSSALLERCFSHAGRAVTPKRARLSTQHATSLIFVHENVRQGSLK